MLIYDCAWHDQCRLLWTTFRMPWYADAAMCGCVQLGTHLRGKRKREELSALLRKAKK